MKNKDQNITSLSDSELDDYILYGIQQQQLTTTHSDDYQHWLNVVAADAGKVVAGANKKK